MPCESWQGFVFVNFTQTGPSLIELFGDLAEKLGSYDFDQMVCVRRLDHAVASVLRRPGPFTLREPAAHRLNDWVLDQVLDGPGHLRVVRDA